MHFPQRWGDEVLAIPSVEFELPPVVDILKVQVADQLIKRPRGHTEMKAERELS